MTAELRESRTIAISLRNLDRIVEVDVENAVLVAEAGAPIARCRDAAASTGMWCPALRWLPSNETIGTAVAAAHGRRSRHFGTTADYLLGIRFACPAVGLARHGGKAIKNATGYNLSGIVAGSRGELGVILQVILRLIPTSRGRVVQLFRIDETQRPWEVGRALARLQTSAADEPPAHSRTNACAIECWTFLTGRASQILVESERGLGSQPEPLGESSLFPGLELIDPAAQSQSWPPALASPSWTCLRAALDPTGIGDELIRIVEVARRASLQGSIVAELTGGGVEFRLEDQENRSAVALRTILGLPDHSTHARSLRSTLKSAFDPHGQLRSLPE